MTLPLHTKTKFTPSNTTHASLNHISNNAETACHRVPHVYQPQLQSQHQQSRASSSPGAAHPVRDNIYKPWAPGFNIQDSGNGTHASTGAAHLLERLVFIVKCITLRGWDGSEVEKRNQSCRGTGRVALSMSSGTASSHCLHHLISQS